MHFGASGTFFIMEKKGPLPWHAPALQHNLYWFPQMIEPTKRWINRATGKIQRNHHLCLETEDKSLWRVPQTPQGFLDSLYSRLRSWILLLLGYKETFIVPEPVSLPCSHQWLNGHVKARGLRICWKCEFRLATSGIKTENLKKRQHRANFVFDSVVP